MNKIIYLSPHLDDAIFSCGSIIWDQLHLESKIVEVWTIFAGDPPAQTFSPFVENIHLRWKLGNDAPAKRRREDITACKRLGCEFVHLEIPDCIYRSVLKTNEPRILVNDDLFNFDDSKDSILIDQLAAMLDDRIPLNCQLAIPLSVGGHIDHQITRLAAEKIGRTPYYYADFPYSGQHPEMIEKIIPKGNLTIHFPFSMASIKTGQFAASAYSSQINSFWLSQDEMDQAIEEYVSSFFGSTLWKKFD